MAITKIALCFLAETAWGWSPESLRASPPPFPSPPSYFSPCSEGRTSKAPLRSATGNPDLACDLTSKAR